MRKWSLALLLAGLLNTGCYKATFIESPKSTLGEEKEQWTDFFVFGLVGTEEFHVKDFCPPGQVAQVRTGGNFLTGLVTLLTIFIYTPGKVYVWCEAEGGGNVAKAPALTVLGDANGKPVRVLRADGSIAELTDAGNGRYHVRFKQEAQ